MLQWKAPALWQRRGWGGLGGFWHTHRTPKNRPVRPSFRDRLRCGVGGVDNRQRSAIRYQRRGARETPPPLALRPGGHLRSGQGRGLNIKVISPHQSGASHFYDCHRPRKLIQGRAACLKSNNFTHHLPISPRLMRPVIACLLLKCSRPPPACCCAATPLMPAAPPSSPAWLPS